MLDRLLNRLNPMSLLLMKEGYPPAVVVAVLLHGALLFFLLDRELAPRDSVDLEQPAYVSAMTIDQNPQRMRRIEQEQARAREQTRREDQREREEQAAREAEERRQAEAEAEQRQRREEAERQQREEEAERQRREEAQQQAREEEAAREQARREEEARQQAAREEAAENARQRAAQQAAQQAAADNQAIQAYTAVIHETVSRNWSIPPSARNGMTVLLNIRLVPTGEVISVNVIESSGDAAFDRSAEQAVLKAERFPELQQMPTRLFEREFRSINLVFRPEDLLR